MAISTYVKHGLLGGFALGMTLSAATAPAFAAPEPCWQAIQYCKTHPHAYPSFEECIAEESLFCGPSVTGSEDGDLLAAKFD